MTASFVAATFTVSTSAGSGGSIDPDRTVDSGTTALFLVSPNPGFRYDTVTGCGGTLDGSTSLYQTGPVTADCTITATFAPLENFNAVAPLYPNNGADWNDYVVGDANGAIDSACDATSSASCLHAGERRLVTVTGLASCTDLTAIDSLFAFTWECSINNSGTAQFISTGLADGKNLSDLLDTSNFITPVFKTIQVFVQFKGGAYGETPPSTWWGNTIENLSFTGSGPSLNSAGRIYLATLPISGKYSLDPDKVSLVMMPGVTLTGPGQGNDSIVVDTANFNPDYVWLEGTIDATGDDIGVNLTDVRFSKLRNVESNNASGGSINTSPQSHNIGVYLTQSSSNNRLEDVTANGNINAGIVLNSSSDNVIARVKASSNPQGEQNIGVSIRNTSLRNSLTSVTAGADATVACSFTPRNGNADTGIVLDGSSSGNAITDTVANCNNLGVSINDSTSINNTLTNVTANFNQGDGVSLKR